MTDAFAERTRLWMPLLRDLSRDIPGWGIWKNAESALRGTGDVDSASPPDTWGDIEAVFNSWARTLGPGAVIVCRHIPRTLNLLAVPEGSRSILQLEVKGEGTLRGKQLFTASAMLSLMEMDDRGFRRLRPGAEGVFKFVTNGTKWGGRPNHIGLASKGVKELLESDPVGVMGAADVIGVGRKHLIRGIEAYLAETWDPIAMATFEAAALGASIRRPRILLERARFRFIVKRSDPVLSVIYRSTRTVPEARERWLETVAASHLVYYS